MDSPDEDARYNWYVWSKSASSGYKNSGIKFNGGFPRILAQTSNKVFRVSMVGNDGTDGITIKCKFRDRYFI